MMEIWRVLELLGDPAALGLFDPVILSLIVGIAVLSLLTLKIMPKRAAKAPVRKAIGAPIGKKTPGSRDVASGAAPRTDAHDAEQPRDGLARLRTIIETGTAQSEKMSLAHVGASIKIDAAEHTLNRMILEMNTVLNAKSAPAPLAAVEIRDVVHGGPPHGSHTQVAA
jgi:hypothetical protein